MMVRSGVDRQASYRLAVGDEDYIDKLEYVDERPAEPTESSGPVVEIQPRPLVEQEVVLKDVQVENPMAMNMVFQKVIAQDNNSVSSSQRSSSSSKCSRETVRRESKIPIDIQIETEPRNSSSDGLTLPESMTVLGRPTTETAEESAKSTDQLVSATINIRNGALEEADSNESILQESTKAPVDSVEDDNVSVSSFVSDVSYRQYVRTIENVNTYNVPDIKITPAKRRSSAPDSDSGDSIHSVESLLHMFSTGIGKLHVPSFQKAKGMELMQEDCDAAEGIEEISTHSSDKTGESNATDVDSKIESEDIDFDDTSFVVGSDIGFASDFLAEFDRKLQRRAKLSSTESDNIQMIDIQDHKPVDQTVTDHIRTTVEEIVEDHLNSLLDSLPTETQPDMSPEATDGKEVLNCNSNQKASTNLDPDTCAASYDQGNLCDQFERATDETLRSMDSSVDPSNNNNNNMLLSNDRSDINLCQKVINCQLDIRKNSDETTINVANHNLDNGEAV